MDVMSSVRIAHLSTTALLTNREVWRCLGLVGFGWLWMLVGCHNGYPPAAQSWQTGAQMPGYAPPPMATTPPMQATTALPPAVPTGPASVYGQQPNPQLADLQRRVQQLDDNNRQLTTQLAQSQQQSQAFRERSDLLAKQLGDLTAQNRQLLMASQQYANQAMDMQASMSARGGAKLTSNTSLPASPAGLQITGAQVVQEGNLIRVRISADQLFTPGTAQVIPAGSMTLDPVAAALIRQYPRQRVAIEGHTDNAQLYGGQFGTPFQLSGAQAQAVMDQLVRRGGVPVQQLIVVAHGPNRPLADNQTPAGRAENRRIEIVIYPETF